MAEMRLIDANALKEKRQFFDCHECGDDCEIDYVEWEDIENAPTIDAVPVVHGRWVRAHGMMPPEYHHRKQCSMCGGWALQDDFGRECLSHYCPNCGARMDAKEAEHGQES